MWTQMHEREEKSTTTCEGDQRPNNDYDDDTSFRFNNFFFETGLR